MQFLSNTNKAAEPEKAVDMTIPAVVSMNSPLTSGNKPRRNYFVHALIFILLFGVGGALTVIFTRADSVITVRDDAGLDSALRSANGGETILLQNGSYGRHYLPKTYSSQVRVQGASRSGVVVAGFVTYYTTTPSTTAGNLSISNMTISGAGDGGDGAIRINKTAHDITITSTTITGGAHNITINSDPYDQSSGTVWAHNIIISNNDLSGSSGDAIQLGGVKDISIANNYIHDLAPPAGTTDHIDGIQSVGSENLNITSNLFSSPSLPSVGGAYPHQGIILGRADPFTSALYVKNTYVANNVISRWSGSGIIVAGTDMTWIVNNTVQDFTNGGGGFYTSVKDPSQQSSSGGGTRGGSASDWFNTNLFVWNNIFSQTNITRTGQAGNLYPALNSNNLITNDAASNVTVGTNNILAAPQFVTNNLSSFDMYKLLATSPARDSGIVYGSAPHSTPSTDYRNQSRDTKPDRGALEYVTATTSVPSASNGSSPQTRAAAGSQPTTSKTFSATVSNGNSVSWNLYIPKSGPIRYNLGVGDGSTMDVRVYSQTGSPASQSLSAKNGSSTSFDIGSYTFKVSPRDKNKHNVSLTVTYPL